MVALVGERFLMSEIPLYAYGPMVVLVGGGAISYERSTPVKGTSDGAPPLPHVWSSYTGMPPHSVQPTGGKGLFINSQTRPLHANEGKQTRRKGTSP